MRRRTARSSTVGCAELKASVNKIIPFSAVDGPGNRTAVFLQGCTFNCCYCHNPETIRLCVHCGECVMSCPAGALKLADSRVVYDHARCVGCDTCIRTCKQLSSPKIRELSASEVMDEVRRNVPFIRGITVSGGECTLYHDFLLELAQLARDEGLGVLLDSNGSYDFSEDSQLTEAIEGVMLDVKAWDEQEHFRLTEYSNAAVLKNLRFLASAGKLEEVRTVVVPGWMSPEETVQNVCKVLVEENAAEVRYKLIRFRPMGVRTGYQRISVPEDGLMRRLENIAHSAGVKNAVLI